MDPQQVFWRCRRGVLELDVIFQPFFLSKYHTLSPQEQTCFQALLAEQDPQLQTWMIYQQDIPEHYAPMIKSILTFRKKQVSV